MTIAELSPRVPVSPPHPAVSVVLPCLDEEEAVGQCVAEALAAMARAGFSGEVVVVDNGSTDRSAEMARESGARVVDQAERGYGAALRAGFGAARGEVVVMADADLTYDLSQLPQLLEPILAGRADLVVGQRIGHGAVPMPRLHRWVGTPALNRLVADAGGVRLHDSQSGFRAIRRTTLAGLDLEALGMELASEMLVKGARAGLRMEEIPVHYRRRVGDSKLDTWSDGWRHLRQLALLAPHVALVRPGAAVAAAGAVLTLLGLALPGGVVVGSLRWQPVFFSTILTVLGLQAWLAGQVITRRSTPGVGGFAARCGAAGVAALVTGLAIDGLLFLRWVDRAPESAGVLPLAALAQTLLLVGGSLLSFAVIQSLSKPAVARSPGRGEAPCD